MPSPKILFGLTLLSLILSGCSSRHVPRLEQTDREHSVDNLVRTRLSASTNCVEVGEQILFTAQIENRSRTPFSLFGVPPIDMVLEPAKNTQQPVQRWSETNQFPLSLDPILLAGESRQYHWLWVADQRYTDGVGVKLEVHVSQKSGHRQEVSPSAVYVGVHTHPLEQTEGGSWRCADFLR